MKLCLEGDPQSKNVGDWGGGSLVQTGGPELGFQHPRKKPGG